MKNFKIALIQMATTASVEQNLENLSSWLEKAREAQVDVAVVPEEFLTLSLKREEKYLISEPLDAGPIQAQLSLLAKKYKLYLIAGTVPIRSTQANKITASMLIYDPTGTRISKYDKIHLFDVSIEGGKESYKESDHIVPGKTLVDLKLPFAHLGLGICYDLRFPELFKMLALKGVNLFVLPSAFTIRTGEKHWETLVRARAIENLSFFVACNNVGLRLNGEGTYGHSMIVGPWGEVLAKLTTEENMLVQEMDVSPLHTLRQNFPVLAHGQDFIIKAWLKLLK